MSAVSVSVRANTAEGKHHFGKNSLFTIYNIFNLNVYLQSFGLKLLWIVGRTEDPVVVVKAEAGKAVPGRVPGRAGPWAEIFLDFRPRIG